MATPWEEAQNEKREKEGEQARTLLRRDWVFMSDAWFKPPNPQPYTFEQAVVEEKL